MEEMFLTPEGAAKLKEELEHLTTVKRMDLARRLREAIKQGDLSENADYIAAKEEQAFLEGKIQEIEATLKRATVVHEASADGSVSVGTRVTVVEDGEDGEEVFLLVGSKEADPREGKISHESPIGRALMGKHVGDRAQAETPGGTIVFKITKIE